MRTAKARLEALENRRGKHGQYIFEWPEVGIRAVFPNQKACVDSIAKDWIAALLSIEGDVRGNH